MTEANQSARKALIVLGMHRSGTSALARVLNLLGVELGRNLMPPDAANPRGYWEHLGIYHIHEMMLNSMGRVWHSLFPFPKAWWLDPVIASYQERLTGIIRAEFSQARLWGLKDPRLCRLMPAWHSIFNDVGCKPHFIYVIRHPEEVAQSLHRRDGFSREKCFWLWLLHGLDAEKESRAYPRIFVTYDELLGDWRATVDRISEGLDLQWPNSLQEVEKEVAEFLDPALRHHHRPAGITVQDPVLTELVAALYEALVRAAGEGGSLSVELVSSLERRLEHERPTLDASLLREELSSLSARLQETQGWVPPMERELAELRARAAQLEAAASELDAQIHAIETSWSWRIIKAVRQFVHIFMR